MRHAVGAEIGGNEIAFQTELPRQARVSPRPRESLEVDAVLHDRDLVRCRSTVFDVMPEGLRDRHDSISLPVGPCLDPLA